MIKAYFYRNSENEIYGFKVYNHGDSIVCAAVSALVINTANSIEALTDEDINYDYDEKGGNIDFELPNIKKGNRNHDCNLLLNSLLLGLQAIMNDNKKQLSIVDDDIKNFDDFIKEV